MSLPGWEDVERRHIVLTGLRAMATSLLVLVVYFVLPIRHDPHGPILLRLTVGLAFFVIALTYEVRAVMRSSRPILRAADALALVIPIFMVVFAWTYLTLARSDPSAFSQPLDRVAALYFTVTVSRPSASVTSPRSRTRHGSRSWPRCWPTWCSSRLWCV